MRVAALQFKARPSLQQGRLDLVDLAHQVKGADLIVAPELAVAGYDLPTTESARRRSEPARGPTFHALAPVARALQSWLVVGVLEAEGARLFNSALVIDRDGVLVGVVRKMLLFEGDEGWATVGEGPRQLFDTGRGTFAVGICMDLNDDRLLAWCAATAPDVLALPTNWVQDEGDVWGYWRFRLQQGWPLGWVDLPGADPLRAAVDTVLVGANSYGVEGAYTLSGASAILSRRWMGPTAPAVGDVALVVDVPRR
jgi:predicted amidohydrolase